MQTSESEVAFPICLVLREDGLLVLLRERSALTEDLRTCYSFTQPETFRLKISRMRGNVTRKEQFLQRGTEQYLELVQLLHTEDAVLVNATVSEQKSYPSLRANENYLSIIYDDEMLLEAMEGFRECVNHRLRQLSLLQEGPGRLHEVIPERINSQSQQNMQIRRNPRRRDSTAIGKRTGGGFFLNSVIASSRAAPPSGCRVSILATTSNTSICHQSYISSTAKKKSVAMVWEVPNARVVGSVSPAGQTGNCAGGRL